MTLWQRFVKFLGGTVHEPTPPKPPVPVPPPVFSQGDAANLAPVNGVRFGSVHDLRPLAFDAYLRDINFKNDKAQFANGMGHYVHPSGNWGQCAFGGTGRYTPQQVVSAWVASPEHFAIMTGPAYTRGALTIEYDAPTDKSVATLTVSI